MISKLIAGLATVLLCGCWLDNEPKAVEASACRHYGDVIIRVADDCPNAVRELSRLVTTEPECKALFADAGVPHCPGSDGGKE